MERNQNERVEAPELATALIEVASFLDQQGWNYCLIGGLAASHWGQARRTEDVDLVLLAALGDEQTFAKPLLKAFRARVSKAAEFAALNRIVLLQAANGVALDISLGALPFESAMLKRAKKREVLPGVSVRTATAEDIVVMKSLAGRPRDVDDIERIIATHGQSVSIWR